MVEIVEGSKMKKRIWKVSLVLLVVSMSVLMLVPAVASALPYGGTHQYYGQWYTLTPATCTEAEVQIQYCVSCYWIPGVPNVYRERLGAEALGHGPETMLAGHVDPTCTEDGSKSYGCSVCGEWFRDENPEYVAARGHDEFMNEDYLDPTCTEDGYKSYGCTRCDYYREEFEEYTMALGHDWSDWVVTVEPTVDEEGEEVRVCLRDDCDEEEIRAIDKLDADADAEEEVEETEKLGDTMSFASIIMSAIASIGAFGGYIVRRKMS
jgi:hypothetical protein